MPTVLRIKGWRVVVFPNDHRPAHVHIDGGDRAAVFNLNCPDGPAELRENYGFRRRDLTEIARVLDGNIPELCRRWSEIHGDP